MDIPQKIKSAIEANKLVIFAGSGLSLKFGLPNWGDLVQHIIDGSNNPDLKTFIPVLNSGLLTPLEVLEKLKSQHNEVKGYIKNNFQIKAKELSLHKDILELTEQIVTTNYDNAFELASNNGIIPAIYTSEFNISEINKTTDKYIFKLHGSYDTPDDCVIYKDQYEKLYGDETAAKEKLKSIFTEKVILFMGFSFNDPDINLIFSNLDKAFGNNNKHYILTKEPDDFKTFKFLETLKITDFNQIDEFIDTSLNYKREIKTTIPSDPFNPKKEDDFAPKIAILIPNPIDLNLSDELCKIKDCFNSIRSHLFFGILNVRTLESIEDFDIVVIASKVFKSKIYIEDNNLKSNLLSPSEICSNIPNDEIPIVFITNEKIEPVQNYPTINISTLKSAIIKKFVFKALKEGKLDFFEEEISIHLKKFLDRRFTNGQPIITSLYNNRDLAFGKKCLTNVIGRIEEQASVASKLINITKTNKLLNIKASGGTGKTTLIKKVAYELYNRGYFREGVTFKSCEHVKSFEDFEEILIGGFNLTNILNFKEHLIDNYSFSKIDLLVILDNFETVVNILNREDLNKAVELLRFTTDYANIAVTSREKISLSDDFEDVYSLTPLITEDAMILFEKDYGKVTNNEEIRILRQDILEELLNNNPLAIKLVTKSRTRLKHISQLRKQLREHFFESINLDYTAVFKNNADLNIERTKSIFKSINYSYTTLSKKEKIAFELLSLFPDGISLSNFKKCFTKEKSKNNISDKELRVIRDKSLVEDYNGTLQLQPIIRRFADFQFNKRPKEIKQKYCSDAYSFNCFLLDLIELIQHKKSTSEALKVYDFYKNNLLNVLSYIPEIEISEKGNVPEKKYLLNYIYLVDEFIVSQKQIKEFQNKLHKIQSYFTDLPHAKTLIEVIAYNKSYFHKEFDKSYEKLSKILRHEDMEKRVFKDEDYIEKRYRNIISNIHSMEGYTIHRIKSLINNDHYSTYLDSHLFYLGITNNISQKKDGFYYYEYKLMFNQLDVNKLEDYIKSLHLEEHLEIMQSTYTLSKVKSLDRKTIQKLVVTNPYTKGLKELMFAFSANSKNEKIKHYEVAISNLSHIKYYYLEALYYYCLFLEDNNPADFSFKYEEGLRLSRKFNYQYMHYLFSNMKESSKKNYEFSYSFYSLPALENHIRKYNDEWDTYLRKNDID